MSLRLPFIVKIIKYFAIQFLARDCKFLATGRSTIKYRKDMQILGRILEFFKGSIHNHINRWTSGPIPCDGGRMDGSGQVDPVFGEISRGREISTTMAPTAIALLSMGATPFTTHLGISS